MVPGSFGRRRKDPLAPPRINVVALAILLGVRRRSASRGAARDRQPAAADRAGDRSASSLMQSPRSRSSGSAPSCCGWAGSSACAGPGLFWIVPFVDTRLVVDRPADDHDELRRRADADVRHRAGQRRRGAVLDGARRREGGARGAGLRAGGELGGADRAARHHRPHRAHRPAARPRADRRRAAAADRPALESVGRHRVVGRDARRRDSRARCRTRCRARRRRRAKSRRASSSARRRWRSRTRSRRRPSRTSNNPTALHLRAMNMLYEGLKEKGALMLIPSSAVESMGMGGLMGAAALQQQRSPAATARSSNSEVGHGYDPRRRSSGSTDSSDCRDPRRRPGPDRLGAVGNGSGPGAAWFDAWYCNGMRTTIDRAGRVVIPAAIRDRAGLTAGSELEITEDELGVRLQRVAPGPKLVKIGRRLVARPSVVSRERPAIDIAALIEEERNRWP